MENKVLCRECKGRCCKKNPGMFDSIPKDWEDLLGKQLVIGIDIVMDPEFLKQMKIDVGNLEGNPEMDKVQAQQIKEDCKLYNMLKKERLVNPKGVCGFFYFLRPMGKKDMAKIAPLIRDGGNRCTYLHLKSGCLLAHENRPFECRELVPGKVDGEFDCKSEGIKLKVAEKFLGYQTSLAKVVREEARRLDGNTDEMLQDLIDSLKENDYL